VDFESVVSVSSHFQITLKLIEKADGAILARLAWRYLRSLGGQVRADGFSVGNPRTA
jgi:hypothetical protein